MLSWVFDSAIVRKEDVNTGSEGLLAGVHASTLERSVEGLGSE